MNVVNISFAACGLIFQAFLIAIYFGKKNMPNIENRIYRCMLIFSLFLTMLDITFSVSSFYLKDHLWIIKIISRFYGMSLVSWLTFLAYYIILVTNSDLDIVKKYLRTDNNKLSKYPLIVAFILNAIILFVPVDYAIRADGVVLYPVGGIYTYTVIVTNILLDLVIIAMIKGRKNIKIKKVTPMIAFMVIESSIMGIYILNRDIAIFSLSCTLTGYLMYHTIENPDLKLINELQLARDQAEKTSNAKTEFLSSMSHELKTPINAILGLSQMIEYSNDLEQIHGDSKDIVIASQNLLELVNGILEVNKLDSNEIEISESKYNLSEELDNIIKINTIKAKDKNIDLFINIKEDIPYMLYGDKEKIKQIISNLLSNAVKYTNNGYVDLRISSINNHDKTKLKIEVIDTGRGFSEEQMNNLYTKFNRLEVDKDSNISGTGLGLAITKSLVELLSGKIDINSEVGVGTTFTVELEQKIIKKDNDNIKTNVEELI